MSMSTGLVGLPGRPLSEIESIAIAGESAIAIAEAFTGAGGPPLAVESDHFALLTRSDGSPTVGRLRDLPHASVELVVLRRAWREPRDVGRALKIARDRTTPGGEVIAADLDVQKLLAGPSPRYPARLFYLAAPEAAERLWTSTASPALLSTEAVRVGLKPLELLTFDDVRSSHDSVAELWAAIRDRGWRGAAWTPVHRRSRVIDEVATGFESAIPAGPAEDREPWYAVVGRRA